MPRSRSCWSALCLTGSSRRLDRAYRGRSRRCRHLFNLPDYRVISSTVTSGRRQVIVETNQPPGCPYCGVIASRRKERRFQRLRDIPVAGAVEVLWSKYRWYCEEVACDRLSFFESTPQVPRRAPLTSRLRDQLVDAVIRSGRAVAETAAGFAVSWWMVRAALNEACLLQLPDVDKLSPRMLGIDEHRFRSVRYFQDPTTKAWTRFEPWMTTFVDLDSGQVLGVVDGRDHKGVGDWLFARPLEWRLAVQVVAIDPSAAFRKALRMWLPRTAVAVDHFHVISTRFIRCTAGTLLQDLGRDADVCVGGRISMFLSGRLSGDVWHWFLVDGVVAQHGPEPR